MQPHPLVKKDNRAKRVFFEASRLFRFLEPWKVLFAKLYMHELQKQTVVVQFFPNLEDEKSNLDCEKFSHDK